MTGRTFLKYLGLTLLATTLLWLPAVYASDFDSLRRESARISTLRADFVQKKKLKILTKPLVSEGKFYYAAPSSIRWEYVKPIKSVVISDGATTRRYIASGGKMVEDSAGSAQAMKLVLDEVAGWMSGKFDANPAFSATLQDGAMPQISLTPTGKSMAGMIERIEIVFSRKDAAVRSVRIVESPTAETLIEFHHIVINSAIEPSVFREVP